MAKLKLAGIALKRSKALKTHHKQQDKAKSCGVLPKLNRFFIF